MNNKKAEIIKHLEEIEKKKGVTILFAVETGSRIWGIESEDSDYDVRFVFRRAVRDYLRVNKQPEVIESFIEDMDFVGFDVFKFIRLYLSSNPTVIEWLESNIVYYDDGKSKEVFRRFIEKKFNPVALYHHYRSMSKQNYLKYLKSGENMTHKKYLYAMRGLINAKWVGQANSIPPIEFKKALGLIKDVPEEIISKLKEIIDLKKEGFEGIKVSKIHLFESYIEEFLKQEDDVENKRLIDYSEVQDYIFELMGLKDKPMNTERLVV